MGLLQEQQFLLTTILAGLAFKVISTQADIIPFALFILLMPWKKRYIQLTNIYHLPWGTYTQPWKQRHMRV